MNSELSYLALQIATNKFGDERLCNLEMKPTSTNHQIFLVRLIFHGAVMLCSGNYHKLLLPISRIYTDPASLRGKLFPTMIDDQFVYTKYSIQDRGKWYKCPNGHPYFIGEVSFRSIVCKTVFQFNIRIWISLHMTVIGTHLLVWKTCCPRQMSRLW